MVLFSSIVLFWEEKLALLTSIDAPPTKKKKKGVFLCTALWLSESKVGNVMNFDRE